MGDLRIFISALLWSSAVWAFVPSFTPSPSRTRYRSSSSPSVILQGWFDRPPASEKKRSTLPKVGLDLKVERPKGYQWKLELTVDFPTSTTGGAVRSREQGPSSQQSQRFPRSDRSSQRQQGLPKSSSGPGGAARRGSQFQQRSRGESRQREQQGRSPPVPPKVVDLNSILQRPKKVDLDRSSSRRKSSSRYGRSTNRQKSQGRTSNDRRSSSWGGLPKLDRLPKLDLSSLKPELPKLDRLPKLDLSSLKLIQLPTVELPKWELDLKSVEFPKVELPKVEWPNLDLFDFDRAGPRAAPAIRKKPVPPKMPPKMPPPIRLREKQRRVVRPPSKRLQTTRSKTTMGSGRYRSPPSKVKRRNKVQQPKYDPLKAKRRRKVKRARQQVKYDLDWQSLEQDLAKFVEDPSSPFWLD